SPRTRLISGSSASSRTPKRWGKAPVGSQVAQSAQGQRGQSPRKPSKARQERPSLGEAAAPARTPCLGPRGVLGAFHRQAYWDGRTGTHPLDRDQPVRTQQGRAR